MSIIERFHCIHVCKEAVPQGQIQDFDEGGGGGQI